MATSGTYAFSMTRDSIINAAFRAMQVFGPFDAGPSAIDITNAAEALNIIAKEMALKGLPLWCVQQIAVPMLTGIITYSLGLPTAYVRPLRILYAFLRDPDNSDVMVTIESRYDYLGLGQKQATGRVTQLFYDPQIGDTPNIVPGSGIITVYDAPADNTTTLELTIQRSIQDFNLATDNPDFPQEAYQMLKWSLAQELCLDYMVKPDVRAEIYGKSLVFTKEFFDSCQEQASVFFTPSERTR